MIPTNNFEELKIFQTIFKNKLYRVTCVSYELAESDAHAQSPTQIKSPGGGQFFQ